MRGGGKCAAVGAAAVLALLALGSPPSSPSAPAADARRADPGRGPPPAKPAADPGVAAAASPSPPPTASDTPRPPAAQPADADPCAQHHDGVDAAALRAADVRRPAELGPAGGGGELTWHGCAWRHGFNNQRQALMTAVLLAVASGRDLVVSPYARNSHDNDTALCAGELFDVPRLRSSLAPLAVRARGGVADDAPNGYEQYSDAVDGTDPLDIAAVASRLRALPSRRVSLRFPRCWGPLLWRLRSGNSDEVVGWAGEVLRRAVSLSPAVLGAASAVVGAARAAGRLHAVHVRSRQHGRDFLPYLYPPAVNCVEHGWRRPRQPCFLVVIGSHCACYQREAEDDRRPVDHADVVRSHARRGAVRSGDSVFIAANDPSSDRVSRVRAAAAEAGAAAFTSADLASKHASVAAAFSRLRSWVQHGAADIAACGAADGVYVPSCAATSSEYGLQLRADAGADGAEQQIAQFVASDNESVVCLASPMPPTPVPSEVQRARLKGRRLSGWLAQRTRADAARR
eukprot:TRINITY_DN26588_c0_g1_i1.p1 TRINITY_DN26588_c0_g1~~TRINITY_DN26588_c0_g1_i1.p1  ORF type:complete len:515 (+),score=156.27 TRINITY_DN26588_c0_g1_i1:28-1572(+)